MRWRPLTWFLLSLLFFLAGGYVWWLSDRWQERKNDRIRASQQVQTHSPARLRSPEHLPRTVVAGFGSATNAPLAAAASNAFPYRLSNTSRSIDDLARHGGAVLLENAFIDTTQPIALNIPEALRAQGEHGTYIIQSRKAINDDFRALLQRAGATVVSYIPENALLVRVSGASAQSLGANQLVQSVLAYEPYYKLRSSLLEKAVKNERLRNDTVLKLTLFADAREATLEEVAKLGGILSEQRSPFGPVVAVRPMADSLVRLAALPGVQGVSLVHKRQVANDLTRVRLGVATNSITTNSYLGLTGSNILVNINDTGVDASHPDLSPRVSGFDLTDANGHGTHVAGIIGSSGINSTNLMVPGSLGPSVSGQFRGMAPAVRLFSMNFDEADSFLQETAAATNAFISNNSWGFVGDTGYDIESASYDAAVRDALPAVVGSQPLLYVFAAGNDGFGNDNGQGGEAGSVSAPATAKNVITVGATELPRNITNEVVNGFGETNAAFAGMTDNGSHVAWFSSRGNVGINLEGTFGRYKPDVVAPGTFVVSTRSGQWDTNAYYSPTNVESFTFPNISLEVGEAFTNSVFIADNATAILIRVQTNAHSPSPFPDLPIYLNAGEPSTSSTFQNNQHFHQFTAGETGQGWSYVVVNTSTQTVDFNLQTVIFSTNDYGNYFQVLSNLNSALAPYYRYESGTSMAAPGVSGVLALMQEFFQRNGRTNSPALMKALLINGARSIGGLYDFQVRSLINYQGWGMVRLTNSIPLTLSTNFSGSGGSPLLFYDQHLTNAVATGQKQTRFIKLSNPARNNPLRVTLVWTDPPGNPAAAIKLVNDLNLVVTNYDNPTNPIVYYGNDFTSGSTITLPAQSNQTANVDFVNNVENVYINAPLGSNYSVTVTGARVNVNAVNDSANTVQDYALVISSGNGEVATALTEAAAMTTVSIPQPDVFFITNSFSANPDISGGLLMSERTGAHDPQVGTGMTNDPGIGNQWRFYVVSNTFGFTNAAFVTFLPPTLSVPRLGVREPDLDNATRVEGDLDMYVSTNSALTNLDTIVLQSAIHSVGRSGTESVVITNAPNGAVYYVGVRSQDQMAVEYGFLGVFSLNPFSERDSEGNLILRGVPLPAVIPDGSPGSPGGALIFGITADSDEIRRVVVTNTITHENFGDLLGNLSHNQRFVVLNNHTFGNGDTNQTFVYDDSGEESLRHTDGPGSLLDFVGEQASGVWLLTMVDNALDHTGRVENLRIRIEPNQTEDDGSLTLTIPPGGFRRTFKFVGTCATNLTMMIQSNTAPLNVYISRDTFPTPNNFEYSFVFPADPGGGNSVSIDGSDFPPLQAGRYNILILNPFGNPPQTIRVKLTVEDDPNCDAGVILPGDAPVTIQDNAITTATMLVTNDASIVSVDVGLKIEHPRISDLAITLISPEGTRVLLCENRGGTTADMGDMDVNATNGFFTFTENTNLTRTPIKFLPPPFAVSAGGGASNTISIADFEDPLLTPGEYFGAVNGWNVQANQVTVIQDPTLTPTNGGTKLLALADARLARTISTVPGRNYILTFERRGPGIIALWRAEGNANDSISTNHGTLVGATFAAGEVGQAFSCNGSGGGVTVPDYDAFKLTNSMTIEGWVRANDVGFLLFRGDMRPGFDCYQLAINPGRILGFGIINQPASASVNDTAPFPLGQWKHVAGTLEGYSGNLRLFVDGALITQTNTALRPMRDLDTNFGPGLGIGGHAGGYNFFPFNGLIDEMSLYERAISPSEINAIYSAGSAGKFDTNTALPSSLAKMQVVVGGISTNTFLGNNTSWQTTSISFTATQTTTLLELEGLEPGMLLDSFALTELATATNLYALPEESLEAFKGENAKGTWRLEVWDNRTGNAVPTPILRDWRLQFVFETAGPTIASIPACTDVTRTVGPGGTYYFRVNVPTNATAATNTLISASGPVNILFNTNSSDMVLIPATTGPTNFVFSSNSVPPLPVGVYFLGIENTTSNAVTFTMNVCFDTGATTNTPPPPQIIRWEVLSNSFCITWTSTPGFSYFVQARTNINDPAWDTIATNLIATAFETTYCVPLPTPYQFFRVGVGVSPAAASISITSITVTATNRILQWTAPTNLVFRVQWASNLTAPINWGTFSNFVTSTNGQFTFIDDGSQTGGFGPMRFYRVLTP